MKWTKNSRLRKILEIAENHKLVVIEDAHWLDSASWASRPAEEYTVVAAGGGHASPE